MGHFKRRSVIDERLRAFVNGGVCAALLYVGLVVVIQALVWTGVLVRVAGSDR